MKFFETDLEDAYIIELEKLEDERGFFTRIWDKKIFKDRGLNSDLVQMSFSYSKQKGTLRGMHFQKTPFDEEKIVRCMKGKIFDVIIDLRKESKTYKKWISFELDSNDLKMIYIPKGFAHGFQTLEDDTEVFYQMSNWFSPEHATGIRWDDSGFNIKWPIKNPIISKKDRSYEKREF
jgi:dTDP-4-dehydrorhamnose 3,5-epimerase